MPPHLFLRHLGMNGCFSMDFSQTGMSLRFATMMPRTCHQDLPATGQSRSIKNPEGSEMGETLTCNLDDLRPSQLSTILQDTPFTLRSQR
jgi:hypothetical protein